MTAVVRRQTDPPVMSLEKMIRYRTTRRKIKVRWFDQIRQRIRSKTT